MRILLSLFLLVFSVGSVTAQQGEWTWMNGQNFANAFGNLGTQGVPSPTNEPAALYEAATWTDLQGNFWMFGGNDNFGGYTGNLWRFEPLTGNWTWMGGPLNGFSPTYGVQGVPSPTNQPGARGFGIVTWTDLNGDLWMFGGSGCDVNNNLDRLADLWRYNIATATWTWMAGPNTANFSGNFGTITVPSPTNAPPARDETRAGWVDTNGDLWLFGGFNLSQNNLNDVWRFSIATNTWTWMAGSNGISTPPSYGTLGVAAPNNTPGGRTAYAHWTDNTGKFWLMGGNDLLNGNSRNDIWRFDPANLLWTWMGGSNQIASLGVVGPLCTFSSSYAGAARNENTACWTDDCNRLWYYGGANPGIPGNDLWVIDISTTPVQQALVRGTNAATAILPSVYGTQNVSAATNDPGGRFGPMAWRDNSGNFWLFGGKDGNGFTNYNSLWRYVPDPNCPITPVAAALATATPDSGCQPLTVSFQSLNSNGLVVNWDFGDGDTAATANPQHTYTTSGSFTVTLLVSDTNCAQTSDSTTLVITVSPGPVLELGPDTVRCLPQPIALTAGSFASVLWSTGANTPAITATASGLYVVSVSDSIGCSATDSLRISDVAPVALSASGTFCEELRLLLDAGSGGGNYLWNTGDTTRTLTATSPGLYVVTVQTGPCVLTDSIVLSGAAGEGALYIPNSFTPNGDGLNDFFKAEGAGITSLTLRIYNRWGELIFETDALGMAWDGRVGNTFVQEDVYVYVIDYTTSCTTTENHKIGRVTVIR